MERIIKYPKTPHLNGSNVQMGDDLDKVDFAQILGKNIVIEEKVDGANVGISFNENKDLLLQSRGHFLTGGYRERHYDLFKKWAYNTINELFDVLNTRYIMYGEWLYAKHKIYYDLLPDYFLEFDIFDKKTGKFLSTPARQELLKNINVKSVPVLKSGFFYKKEEILNLLQKSLYISNNAKENLKNTDEALGLDYFTILNETDESDLAEGLYIKVESENYVENRVKFVRAGYIQPQTQNGRWIDKTIIPNKLKD